RRGAVLFTSNCLKVWDFETIDAADSVDDTGLLEMEHMNELLVGKNVNLSSIMKIHDLGQPIWYAQDSNGAIWKLDLSFSNVTHDPECLFTFHSGKIEAMGVSPVTYLMATTALDHSVRIYDFIGNCQLTEIKFKQGGTALTWAPRVVNPKGGLIAVGFEDGVVRIIEVYDPRGLAIVAGRINVGNAEMRLKQAFKPHTAAVTALAYERNGEVLATGSKDKTVFFFAVEDKYEPIGYICVPGPVQALQWSPPSHAESMLLVLCENGFVLQVPAPILGEQDTVSTYEIKDLPTQYFHFCSIKSRIKREEEIERREKKKQEEEKARLAWIKKQQDMGLEIEEEPEAEPKKEEPLPPIYIPEEPSPIVCGFYSAPEKFWLSLIMLLPFSCISSIENAKKKKEYDQIMKAAEDKKNKKRQELIILRHEFHHLLQRNMELPKHMQLHREVHIRLVNRSFIPGFKGCHFKMSCVQCVRIKIRPTHLPTPAP
uniref:WD repeat-containing protein 52 n=1 Tax=Chelydra serpentina TaxID=8475 RepID=A0A8C3SP00_CHESE